MPGEALRPEDIVEVTQDPDNPTAFRIQVLLRDDLDPATVETLRNSEAPPEPQPSTETPRLPQRNRFKEARVGPVEVRIDMGPIMAVIDRLFSGALPSFQMLAQRLSGTDFAQLVFEIMEGRRKPSNSLEEMIARTLLGRTRFEMINEGADD